MDERAGGGGLEVGKDGVPEVGVQDQPETG